MNEALGFIHIHGRGGWSLLGIVVVVVIVYVIMRTLGGGGKDGTT